MQRELSTLESLITALARSLLALRLGVFIVMLMWTLDKFVNPAHAGKVFEAFYGISWLTQNVLYVSTEGTMGKMVVTILSAVAASPLWTKPRSA